MTSWPGEPNVRIPSHMTLGGGEYPSLVIGAPDPLTHGLTRSGAGSEVNRRARSSGIRPPKALCTAIDERVTRVCDPDPRNPLHISLEGGARLDNDRRARSPYKCSSKAEQSSEASGAQNQSLSSNGKSNC